MDHLRAIQYFISTVELGGFSAAAERHGVPASSISRRVSDLESHLQAQLLVRSTRKVTLTEVGRDYFNEVTTLVDQLTRSEQRVKNYQTEPQGRLKISSMVGFGERVLLPLLDEFMALYPSIVVDVELSDALSKLGRDDVDIAFRGGVVPDERILAVPLLNNQFVMVASPKYLAEHGVPTHTQDLTSHKGLFFKTPMGATPWLTQVSGQWQNVAPNEGLTSNNGRWLVQHCISGEGLLMLPRWVIREYLGQGELVELKFADPLQISEQKLGVYMLYQKLDYHVPKIKVAVDFLVARVRQQFSSELL